MSANPKIAGIPLGGISVTTMHGFDEDGRWVLLYRSESRFRGIHICDHKFVVDEDFGVDPFCAKCGAPHPGGHMLAKAP